MIKKEELRIGNLVHYVGTDETQVVEGLDQENVFLDCITADYVGFEEVFPIEITEKHIELISNFLRANEIYWSVMYSEEDGDSYCDIYISDSIFHFTTIHEVQNFIFLLTDKEFTIKDLKLSD